MPPRVDFIQQRTVRKQSKITFPDKVANRLIPNQSSDFLRARWNINKEHRDVVISTENLGENYTEVQEFSTVDIESERVTTPDKIENLLNLNPGDDVYFIGMSDDEYPVPAVLFWTFERMEEIIMEGNKQTSYDYLRVPEFV